MKKRMISMLLAAMMAVSFSAVSVSAEDKYTTENNIPLETQNEDNYFRFIEDGKERIDRAGNFVFDITSGINSTRFYVTNTTVQVLINATADVEDQYVSVFIWDADNDEMAGFHTYPCDGSDHIKNFSGLDTNTKYYLKISNISKATRITGSGRIGWTKPA